MSDKSVMLVPPGSGSFKVESSEYIPNEHGEIEVDNPNHVTSLQMHGCTWPAPGYVSGQPEVFGTRVQPSDASMGLADGEDVQTVVEQRNALVIENERLLALVNASDEVVGAMEKQLSDLEAEVADLRSKVAAHSSEDKPETEESEKASDENKKIVDPGFTEESDYKEILAWLKDHGAVVPNNISKVAALKAVADVLKAQ